MTSFAERTGVDSERPQQRYLWTDAFAVCNFLELARATGEKRHHELALRLVDQVHHTLGKHRADDSRSGWISGLGEQAGASHPTQGGLRIGKRLPERRAGEPLDEQLEWDRDGQYFHYLTKWMHALDQVSRATREPRFNLWARELASAAYRAFTSAAPGGRRMAWKMSIDLTRPLVPSMGQHDPLDGFITCAQLQMTASRLGPDGSGLEEALAGFASLIESGSWATDDPLGIGGLLMDACRVAQLRRQGARVKGDLLRSLLEAARESLRRHAEQNHAGWPASRRLAFRELGLAIGLHAIEPLETYADLRAMLEPLRPYLSLGSAIESFWLEPEHREDRTWLAHRDIDEVMLATSLLPEGFLILSPLD
jgi:hypothetical protein